jgi:hypothetical protein
VRGFEELSEEQVIEVFQELGRQELSEKQLAAFLFALDDDRVAVVVRLAFEQAMNRRVHLREPFQRLCDFVTQHRVFQQMTMIPRLRLRMDTFLRGILGHDRFGSPRSTV